MYSRGSRAISIQNPEGQIFVVFDESWRKFNFHSFWTEPIFYLVNIVASKITRSVTWNFYSYFLQL